MANQHYDLIIAGDAPGARIAGILLGRTDLRILHLHGRGWPQPLLWNTSDLLTDLLDKLQGRHCLTPAVPLQLYSDTACIEIHGAIPWQEELRREHPQSFSQLQDCLLHLEDLGKSLQHCFEVIGGSPSANLRHRLAWTLTTMRYGLSRPLLQKTVGSWISDQQLPATGQKLLETLFSAACLAPIDQLSLAEAALAWAQLLSRQTVAGRVLEKLLQQRLADTGATRRPISELSQVQPLRTGVIQCHLGKDSVSCERLFLAATPATKIPGWPALALAPTGAATWKMEQLSRAPSRLLAPRLLAASAGGGYQVAIGQHQGQAEAYLRCPAEVDPASQHGSGLEFFFGSAEYDLCPLQPGGPVLAATGPCGERGPIRLGKGIYQGCAERLYPHLCLTGEALTALTLFNLAGKGRKG